MTPPLSNATKPVYLTVPANPPDALIESMCYRYDHGHGIKSCFPPETDEDWRRRQDYNRTVMRQLYEEATGQGFCKIPGQMKVFFSTQGETAYIPYDPIPM